MEQEYKIKELKLFLTAKPYYIRNDGCFAITPDGPWQRGSPDKNGYMRIRGCFKKRFLQFYVHRAVGLCFVFNPCTGYFCIIDHIDGNVANNHHSNLRWVDTQLNGMWRHNVKPRYVKVVYKKCGKTQVFWKWEARTSFEGKDIKKYFATEKEANEYLTAFRSSEFTRIYNRKIKENNEEKTRGPRNIQRRAKFCFTR